MNHLPACNRYLLDLAALSAGEAAAIAELREHLRRCEGCSTLLEALALQHGELGEVADPPGFEEALAGLHARVMAEVTAPLRRSRPWRPMLLWAAAACLVLLSGSWQFTRSHRAIPVPRAQPSPIAQVQPPAMSPIVPNARPDIPALRGRRPAAPYDPVRVARQILESNPGTATQTVLIQQSPQVVIYWVKPNKETSHEI